MPSRLLSCNPVGRELFLNRAHNPGWEQEDDRDKDGAYKEFPSRSKNTDGILEEQETPAPTNGPKRVPFPPRMVIITMVPDVSQNSVLSGT